MNQSQLCPRFEKAVGIISQRWTALIVYQLLNSGPQRFSEIEAAITISGKVLSERLKELELKGIVKRDVYPETPVRIEYSLTDKGLSLKPLLIEIEKWSKEWISPDEI
ncbi:winged helix-turn-helix transcriptional regulator [Paenibacillus marinisediminis]